MQQLDKDEPEDKEAVEVATYDPSKFKKFQPDSLAVDEARRAFLEASSKVIKYQCVFLLFYLAFGNFSYMDMCTVFHTVFPLEVLYLEHSQLAFGLCHHCLQLRIY